MQILELTRRQQVQRSGFPIGAKELTHVDRERARQLRHDVDPDVDTRPFDLANVLVRVPDTLRQFFLSQTVEGAEIPHVLTEASPDRQRIVGHPAWNYWTTGVALPPYKTHICLSF